MVDGTLLITSLIPEDSGNYTCLPSNGLLNPPSASANLTVMHAALALPMPRRTYLPAGMEGVYPGWTLTPGGSLLMTTVNDDAAGVYTCTPYNSYGSAGPSGPTDVILQDPPSFSVAPEEQYRREAGGTLLVPCQGNKDPTMKVTWSKVDSARRTSYSVEPNGSLLLRPLAKDHQGAWECSVANRVASVKAGTRVFVLGE
ncbi:Protein turtle A [Liparis tanakae]|uniref:Protein turtle A n=1 Tax=Liparis tanakae TaxID=230148 RepID=A0A4Z2FYR5_9TELE|nr:Protein turtle A [Liparis tanakae]